MAPEIDRQGERGGGAASSGGAVEARRRRVTVIGSGNWGSVAAKIIATNAAALPSYHGERAARMRLNPPHFAISVSEIRRFKREIGKED